LVEVVIAIGLFAFVIVGILGLFPAALRIRSESALETRSYLIAQQLFSQVAAAPNISNVTFRDGPFLGPNNSRKANLARTPIVMGYLPRTSLPYWYYADNPNSSWSNVGSADPQLRVQQTQWEIDTLARLSATNVPGWPNLYQITVEVRAPSTLPLTNTKPVSFVTYQAF
jgi:type II secretory pathway pseudopilin PulG